MVTENQPMLQSSSGLDSQFTGAQFMDYPNYGPSMTSLPNTYNNSGGHHGLDMVFLIDISHVA